MSLAFRVHPIFFQPHPYEIENQAADALLLLPQAVHAALALEF